MDPDRSDSGATSSRSEARLEREFTGLHRRVVSAVRRACPLWLSSQVEDIAQSVMTRLLASMRKKGEGVASFSSIYLEKAAYGATVDEIRRLSRRKETPLENPVLLDTNPSAVADPERQATSSEISRQIRECLTDLPRDRRLAVTLYLQGCNVPETAERLQWKMKRAENLVYRGMADLRRCLKIKGWEP